MSHFDDLDAIWERIEEVQHLSIRGAKSLQKKLGEHRGAAELARRLTIIETRVPSALENPGVTRKELDEARLNRLFDEMAFGGMLRRRCLLTG